MTDFEQLKKLADSFFDWPTEDRTQVTLTSAILFAQHVLAAAPQQAAEPVAWISIVQCVGPDYGKERYGKLPVQSLQPGYYRHVPLYRHPPAQPVVLPVAITPDEMAALSRFCETCDDGQEYDVPVRTMQKLAEIGLVRRTTASRYEITDFGLAVTAGKFNAWPVQPLSAEYCDEDVYKNGQSIGIFELKKDVAAAACAIATQITGRKFDWHYTAGRVHIKAEQPAPRISVDPDALSNYIRLIDGCHVMGAGDLAEKIAAWVSDNGLTRPAHRGEL